MTPERYALVCELFDRAEPTALLTPSVSVWVPVVHDMTPPRELVFAR